MSTNSGAVIMQIDLKKRKLQEEILQLQRELQKQEKRSNKQDHSSKKQRMKMSITHEDKTASKLTIKETKDVKPAISENWKQLFRLQPQLYQPQAVKYFDKDDYRVQANYSGPSSQIYTELSAKVQQEWQNAL